MDPALSARSFCFVLAAGLAIVNALVRGAGGGEYGASEGPGTVAGQILPLGHCRVGARSFARLAGNPPTQKGPVRTILAAARTDEGT